jgi:hypothetical protein
VRVRAHTVEVRVLCMQCEGSIRGRERTFFRVPVGQEHRAAMLEIAEAWCDGWREVYWVSISRGDPYTTYAVRHEVWNSMRKHPEGSTADEIAFAIGRGILTVRPRVSELARAGILTDSGARRPNSTGRRAIVWVLADKEGSDGTSGV